MLPSFSHSSSSSTLIATEPLPSIRSSSVLIHPLHLLILTTITPHSAFLPLHLLIPTTLRLVGAPIPHYLRGSPQGYRRALWRRLARYDGIGRRRRASGLGMNNPKKSVLTMNESFLGILYPTESYKVYGYLTNIKVKFLMVTTDLNVKDADVRSFFRRFHAAYVDAVSNPFHVPGKKIASRTFAKTVSGIVKCFSPGTNG
ncbi:trafficking protein particle complex subunit 2-like protein [Canna indica]|uniref:Trafficking protein particle complex subunit 2-like protein n=1 Tax=Canna indica TaxID=4628 RepID=A0AAQ3QD16_9LILI|nr:trafficking protein particle complex subunit 2-like protein [Canna indica]